MKKKSLIIFGCRSNTLNFINSLDLKKFNIKYIVTIPPSVAKRNKVSGYINLKTIKKIKPKVIFSNKYNLKNNFFKYFKKNKSEFGVSIGWQRIIPQKILNTFKKGVFGMHCSYLQLPNGKGRSPITWSIIKGYDYLYVQIFKYTSDYDEGPIIFKKKINIFNYESIDDIQKKLSLVFSDFINSLDLRKIKFLKNKKIHNKKVFKKRDENSGLIILKNHTPLSVCNFIRSQSDPYPCAYFLYKKNKLKISHAQIFNNKEDYLINKNLKFYIFSDNTFIFKIKNQYVYVKKHKIKKNFLTNEIFTKIFV